MARKLTSGGRTELNLFSEKDMRPSYLIRIATEGRKTEYNYFEGFDKKYNKENPTCSVVKFFGNCFGKNSAIVVLDILPSEDNKSDPESVLNRLLKSVESDNEPDDSNSAGKTGRADEYWLVVDVDQFTQLPSIVKQAKEMGIKVAVSNLCFEIWLLMYSQEKWSKAFLKALDTDVADDLVKRLRQYDASYQKGRLDISRYKRHEWAIERAKKMDANKSGDIPDRPGTRVYKLVEIILERLKPRN